MRRAIDLVTAAVLLVLLAPVLFLIALLVRWDSPGGALYGSERVGRHGRVFRMWKFRTMVAGADRLGSHVTAPMDARVTRLGSLLRRTKLDELPQCWNLLRGDLTLVGPRPEVPSLVARYTEAQRATLLVRPGITGPGTLHYTAEQAEMIPPDVDPDEYYVANLLGPKLQRDLDYLAHRSVRTDLRILYATALVMLRAVFGLRTRPVRAARQRNDQGEPLQRSGDSPVQ